MHVGVLQFSPSFEPFPLLPDIQSYSPSTVDIGADPAELQYWVDLLRLQIPTVVEKAAASEQAREAGWQHSAAQRRAASFGRTLDHHLRSLRANPRAYGSLGLADLFELREECLREFGFRDVYASDKAREHAAALEALPDLLTQLDARPVHERLLALVQGALAANIFDWGAQACVDLYQNATILEMYRTACTQLSCRPWLVDDLAELAR
ncbi:hypothetical protein H632_c3590p0, partial [Helicosporidium sp. ATCC 50920]